MGKCQSTLRSESHTGLLFLVGCILMIVLPFSSLASPEDDTTSVTEEELYLQCKRAFSQGGFAEAGRHIERFCSLYPESDHAGEMLFMQAFLQPVIDTSIETYQMVIEKYPDSEWAAKSHFQLGQCYYLQGDYDKALDHYGKIIISYPEDKTYWPARYWKCKSLIAMGDYEQAMAALRSLDDSVSTEIGGDMILMAMGNCYLGMQDYENAATSYRSLIESMPDSQRVPSAYLLLARSLQSLGKPKEAEVLYRKVMESYSKSIEARQAQEYLSSLSSVQPESAVPETVGTTRASTVQEASYFSIQVGAFSLKQNATNLARKLRSKGYSVDIIAPIPGKSRFYKVRVGRYRTRSGALRAARRLGRNENLPTEVVP